MNVVDTYLCANVVSDVWFLKSGVEGSRRFPRAYVHWRKDRDTLFHVYTREVDFSFGRVEVSVAFDPEDHGRLSRVFVGRCHHGACTGVSYDFVFDTLVVFLPTHDRPLEFDLRADVMPYWPCPPAVHATYAFLRTLFVRVM